MVRPDLNTWGQSPADLRCLSVDAQHRRSRERFLALYMIATQQTNATTWAAQIGRTKDTVLSWVHCYNLSSPEGLAYRRTGGRRPFLPRSNSTASFTRSPRPTRLTTACPVMPGPFITFRACPDPSSSSGLSKGQAAEKVALLEPAPWAAPAAWAPCTESCELAT